MEGNCTGCIAFLWKIGGPGLGPKNIQYSDTETRALFMQVVPACREKSFTVHIGLVGFPNPLSLQLFNIVYIVSLKPFRPNYERIETRAERSFPIVLNQMNEDKVETSQHESAVDPLFESNNNPRPL